MRMPGHDHVDVVRHPAHQIDEIGREAVAPVDVGARGRAALVNQDDNRADALLPKLPRRLVGRLRFRPERQAADARWSNHARSALQDQPDESDSYAADVPDREGRKQGPRRRARHAGARNHPGIGPLRIERDVGREVLEGRARERRPVLAAVDGMATAGRDSRELPPTFVELVIADGGNLKARKVQRLNRRFIVREARQQRRPADIVAGRDDDGVRVRGLQAREVRREVLHPTGILEADLAVGPSRGLERAVKVIDREQLDVHCLTRDIGDIGDIGDRGDRGDLSAQCARGQQEGGKRRGHTQRQGSEDSHGGPSRTFEAYTCDKWRVKQVQGAGRWVASSAGTVVYRMLTMDRVVVVGAGCFGAWTAYHLARSGHTVTLLDAYGAGNTRASSGGETRVIRLGYGAQEIYTRWAWRSLELWKALFERVDPPLFLETGVLWMAHEHDTLADATLAALERAGVPHERLTRAELESRWPQIDFGGAAAVSPSEGSRGRFTSRAAAS